MSSNELRALFIENTCFQLNLHHILAKPNHLNNNPKHNLHMKKITFILIAFITGTAFSQTTVENGATATASAGIVSTINVEKTQDLNFGGIVAGTTGTVLLSTAGAATPTTVALVAGTVVSQAQFEVLAAENVLFTVTVPTEDVTITTTAQGTGTKTMVVNAFTHDAGSAKAGAGSTPNEDEVTVNVGATLNVLNTQNDGLYTGTFDVTVDYQ